ncbi:MAG TPA: SH3 domain-containing protein [Ktedonobacterales bacterium]
MHSPLSRDASPHVIGSLRALVSRWARGPARDSTRGIPTWRVAVLSLAAVSALAFAVSANAPAHAAGLSTASPTAPGWISAGHDAQIVNNDFLHLRARPDIYSPVLAIMYRGEIVRVNSGPTWADDFAWWNVTYHGQRGYAAANWLAPVSAPVSTPVCSAATNADAVVANSSILHLRYGPGLHYTVRMTMRQGDHVHVHDGPYAADGYHWMLVDHNGVYGYAAREYLVATSCAPQTAHPVYEKPAHLAPRIHTYVQVSGYPYLHLRTGPSVHSRLIATMPEGAVMYVNSGPEYGDGYTWFCVTYQGRSGYAASDWMYPTVTQ